MAISSEEENTASTAVGNNFFAIVIVLLISGLTPILIGIVLFGGLSVSTISAALKSVLVHLLPNLITNISTIALLCAVISKMKNRALVYFYCFLAFLIPLMLPYGIYGSVDFVKSIFSGRQQGSLLGVIASACLVPFVLWRTGYLSAVSLIEHSSFSRQLLIGRLFRQIGMLGFPFVIIFAILLLFSMTISPWAGILLIAVALTTAMVHAIFLQVIILLIAANVTNPAEFKLIAILSCFSAWTAVLLAEFWDGYYGEFHGNRLLIHVFTFAIISVVVFWWVKWIVRMWPAMNESPEIATASMVKLP